MLRCQKCSNPTDPQTQFCPYCNAANENYRPTPDNADLISSSVSNRVYAARLILIATFLLILGIGFAAYLSVKSPDANNTYLVTEYLNGKEISRSVRSGSSLTFEGIAGITIVVVVGGAVYL